MWPASAIGPFPFVPFSAAAVGMVGGDSAAAAMSPSYSDGSQQERLIPKSLFSDPTSTSRNSIVSDALSPENKKLYAEPQLPSFQGPDDRWVCIPHGIVEHYKSRFENPGTTDEDAEAPPGAVAVDGNTTSASDNQSGPRTADTGSEEVIFEVEKGLPIQRPPSTRTLWSAEDSEKEEEQA